MNLFLNSPICFRIKSRNHVYFEGGITGFTPPHLISNIFCFTKKRLKTPAASCLFFFNLHLTNSTSAGRQVLSIQGCIRLYILGAIRGCCLMSLKANRLSARLPKQAVQRLGPGKSTIIYADCAAPHRAPRHPGNAHRGQRTPHDGFSRRHQTLSPGERNPLSNLRSESHDDPGLATFQNR